MVKEKGSHENPKHRARPKKRKYHAPEGEKKGKEFVSASAQKILGSKNMAPPVHREFGYNIIDFFTVFTTLATFVICKHCKQDIKFSQTGMQGLGFKILVQCDCADRTIRSCPMIAAMYDINIRLVFVIRLLGQGYEGLRLFLSLMDFHGRISQRIYYSTVNKIYEAASVVYECAISKAVAEEKQFNEENGKPADRFSVSGDGTWKKRGFSSLFGAASLIGKFSKKVVDSIVKSKFCDLCNKKSTLKKEDPIAFDEWYETHEKNCTANHEGSSAKMEVDGILEMFRRSKEKHGVLYTTYIGDGDCKTFKGIIDGRPYGDEITVTKKECVGHVEKRMGRRLRQLKGLGGRGKGRLTVNVISSLTKYYGLAIRRHPDSVADMQKAIWATFFHKKSSDKKPCHDNCPVGPESWCSWQRSKSAGTLSDYKHKEPLCKEVLEKIKPIYEELSKPELLEKCLGAETQNSNESLNSLIWTFAPKHLHSGPRIVEIANFLAVIIFNEGFTAILKVLDILGCVIGTTSTNYAELRDSSRINRSENRVSDGAKRARIEQRAKISTQNDLQEMEEGILYAPGLGDD